MTWYAVTSTAEGSATGAPSTASRHTSPAGIGAAGLGAGIAVIAIAVGMVTPGKPQLAERVYSARNTSTLGSALFLLAPVFAAGFLLLAVALWRSPATPRQTSVLLAVGIVLATVAPAGGTKGAVLHLPFAAAVALLRLRLRLLRPAHGAAVRQAATVASTSAPYRSSFAGSTPAIYGSSPSVDARRAAGRRPRARPPSRGGG